MDPIRRPPEGPPAAADPGLLPEEMEMLLEAEPLAGPLPVEEGGRMLEPLALPAPGLRRHTGVMPPEPRKVPSPVQIRGESFWSFGGGSPAAPPIDDWEGR